MRLLSVGLIALLTPALLSASNENFDVHPAPAWVEKIPVDLGIAVPKSDVRWGVYTILDDHQVRSTGDGTTDFSRRVRKIVSSNGVQNASEIDFDFDPSFERLVIHDITLIRGSERFRELGRSKIRVIEKENDSGNGIYDGMLTAVAFLDDVRPGDVLDFSWSVEGANPLLAGKYADTFDVTTPVPARLIRHRLLFPSSRKLRYRTITANKDNDRPPQITRHGSETEFVWERRDAAPLDVEDSIPAWFDPYDHIQVTEFASWNEVARWADALFQVNVASRTAVQQLAQKFRSEHASPEDQVVAAIRFVQDDIRYLGIEMGRNSHEPHQPAEVLDQRWGDCKDKAFLLAVLLRELGLDARPAMVNTKLRRKLDDQLPSPFMFDHVITQVVDRGSSYWIDPTLSDQGGILATIETPNDERALVVREETTCLSKIVTNQKGSTTIEQTYTTTDWNSPTLLVVRSVYSGGDADLLRANLASMSSADLARDRLNRYAASHPRIQTAAPTTVQDDRSRNVIVINDRYTVRDLWRGGKFAYTPHAIDERLERPETIVRSMPLAFDYPLDLTETATFRLPGKVDVEERKGSVTDPAFRFDYAVANDGTTVTIRHRLSATSDAVPVANVPDHLVRINEISEDLGCTLERPQGGVMASAKAGRLGFGALGLVLVGSLIAFGLVHRFRG
jgi:transglutaminase-like putative cysteine protease